MALSENPFDRFSISPCLLVRLKSADSTEQRIAEIRAAISRAIDRQVPGVTVSGRELAAGVPSDPSALDLAIVGPDRDQCRRLAVDLTARLRKQGSLVDPAVTAASILLPQMSVDIDRKKAADVKVSLAAAFAAVRDSVDSPRPVGKCDFFGRSVPILIENGVGSKSTRAAFERIKVRGGDGRLIPLSAIATIQRSLGPATIERLNLEPMIEIRAHLGQGTTAAAARTLCESLAGAAPATRLAEGLSARLAAMSS